MEKDKTFMIVPTHKERGYTAPAIAVTAKDYSVAVTMAEKSSQLSKWPDKWYFI